VPLLGLAVVAFGAAAFLHGGSGGIGVGRLPYWFLFFGIGVIASGGSFGVVFLGSGPSVEAPAGLPVDASFVRIPAEEWAEIRAQLAEQARPRSAPPPTPEYLEDVPLPTGRDTSLPIAAVAIPPAESREHPFADLVARTWPTEPAPVSPPSAPVEPPPTSAPPIPEPAAVPTSPPASPPEVVDVAAAETAPVRLEAESSAVPVPAAPTARPAHAAPPATPTPEPVPDGPACASCGKRMSARSAWRKCSVCGKPLCASCLTSSVRSQGRGYCSGCMPASAPPAASS
jgi:hypothetical protein